MKILVAIESFQENPAAYIDSLVKRRHPPFLMNDGLRVVLAVALFHSLFQLHLVLLLVSLLVMHHSFQEVYQYLDFVLAAAVVE